MPAPTFVGIVVQSQRIEFGQTRQCFVYSWYVWNVKSSIPVQVTLLQAVYGWHFLVQIVLCNNLLDVVTAILD